ncbi:MAG TPA: hypothetical protein VFH47_01350, partial [Candidatus Thermoplasmatota archaeon]|nr:hypothetical protein [Candidatus Thermoplasmatota archaeon]
APRPRWLPQEEDVVPTLLAVTPWLGLPYLVSANLAASGHKLPGRILPVVAFLPLVALAYLAAMRLPLRTRAWLVGGAGALLTVLALARLGHLGDRPYGPTIVLAAAGLTALAVAAAYAAGSRWGWMRSGLTLALLASQCLDGFVTYLSVVDPFGWLPYPHHEQVHVSRWLLEHAPPLFPALKAGLALFAAYALLRGRLHGDEAAGPRPLPAAYLLLLAAVVAYAGLQPALFSSAHVLHPDVAPGR